MKHRIIITSCLLLTLSAGSLLAARQGAPEPAQPPTPAEITQMALADFDIDASMGLDVNEFTELLAFLHENRPARPPRGDGRRMGPARVGEGPPPGEDRVPSPDAGSLAAGLVKALDCDRDRQLSEPELVSAFELMHILRHRGRGPGRP